MINIGYMDLKKFNIYNYSNEKYVEVDDFISYAIQTLNKKGYKTKYCCSGHYGYDREKSPNEEGYIYFKEAHNFKDLPEFIEQDGSHIIRFYYTTKSNTKERYDELIKMSMDLSCWADSLENKSMGDYGKKQC